MQWKYDKDMLLNYQSNLSKCDGAIIEICVTGKSNQDSFIALDQSPMSDSPQ